MHYLPQSNFPPVHPLSYQAILSLLKSGIADLVSMNVCVCLHVCSIYPLLAGTKLVQHFNPLPFGFCRHRWQREHLIEKCSHVLQITWKTKRPVDRAGQADTHTHTHPLQTPCRRYYMYVQYHQPVSTDSSNNSPNVRSINVNKMDATAYPVARPICWIESDKKRERENEWDEKPKGAEKTSL